MDPDEDEPFGGAMNIGSETTEAEREFEKVRICSETLKNTRNSIYQTTYPLQGNRWTPYGIRY